MSESVPSSRIPDSVRVTGWVIALLAARAIASAGLHVVVRYWQPDQPIRTGAAWAVWRFSTSLAIPEGIARAVLAAVLVVAGVMLALGREWARRVVGVLLWLVVPWSVYWAVVGVWSQFAFTAAGHRWAPVLMGVGTVVNVALWMALIWVAWRWLNSPAVRDACRRPPEAAPAEQEPAAP
jgi:hypothetical protein